MLAERGRNLNLESVRGVQNHCGLTGAQERARIDGVEFHVPQFFGERLRLGSAFVGEGVDFVILVRELVSDVGETFAVANKVKEHWSE